MSTRILKGANEALDLINEGRLLSVELRNLPPDGLKKRMIASRLTLQLTLRADTE